MKNRTICKWFSVCPLKRFYEQEKVDKRWVEEYCWDNYLKCERYKMEDRNLYHPDNMMPDGTIDKNLE